MNIAYPKSVIEAAMQAAEQCPENAVEATEIAARKIRKLPEFAELVNKFVYEAIRELIYDLRHSSNVKMRKANGEYFSNGGDASQAVNEAYECYYQYRIGGTILKLLTGAKLKEIAASEAEKASGHLFNSRLCACLAEIVPEDKTVEQVVSKRKLKTEAERIRKEMEKE